MLNISSYKILLSFTIYMFVDIIEFYCIYKFYIYLILFVFITLQIRWIIRITENNSYFQIKTSGVIFFNWGPPEEPVENK